MIHHRCQAGRQPYGIVVVVDGSQVEIDCLKRSCQPRSSANSKTLGLLHKLHWIQTLRKLSREEESRELGISGRYSSLKNVVVVVCSSFVLFLTTTNDDGERRENENDDDATGNSTFNLLVSLHVSSPLGLALSEESLRSSP